MDDRTAGRLILASASPRRSELLALLGRPFEVITADVDEAPLPNESAGELVVRLARAKASAVAQGDQGNQSAIVIGADTVVVVDGDIIGKPRDVDDAANILRRLSGRAHHVMTGVSVMATNGNGNVDFVETTVVTFAPLTDRDIDEYIATGEPMDKAGAYGIQGHGGRFVTAINGSYHNVVGLPVAQLAAALEELAAQ